MIDFIVKHFVNLYLIVLNTILKLSIKVKKREVKIEKDTVNNDVDKLLSDYGEFLEDKKNLRTACRKLCANSKEAEECDKNSK